MIPKLRVTIPVLSFCLTLCQGYEIDDHERKGRAFSIFQIVNFPNSGCAGSSSKNGTCYTAAECSSRGGSNAGSCANGYGVCCTFTIRCGTTTSENCTYFESLGTEAGGCAVSVCPCSTNICQLRLDFNTFSISGPSTSSASAFRTLNGNPTQAAPGVTSTAATQCLTDTFSVTSPGGGGVAPPVICGVNTGEHMYVAASPNCNQLVFQLAAAGSRSWSVKVSQYNCDYPNLAPTGCVQYFFGSTTNTVRTFNYNAGNGYHLANQMQTVCVRRERGTCRICWTAQNAIDFMLSGNAATANGRVGTSCCGYGTNGAGQNGYDCVIIPSATQQASTQMAVPGGSAFCGRSQGLVTKTASLQTPRTVCSRREPFQLRFFSDNFEFVTEAAGADRGFQLAYILSGTNC